MQFKITLIGGLIVLFNTISAMQPTYRQLLDFENITVTGPESPEWGIKTYKGVTSRGARIVATEIMDESGRQAYSGSVEFGGRLSPLKPEEAAYAYGRMFHIQVEKI